MSLEKAQVTLDRICCPFTAKEIFDMGIENFQSTLYKAVQKDNGNWNIINKQTGFIRSFNFPDWMAIKEMALLRKYQ